MRVESDIEEIIRKCHGGDEHQMEVILSDSPQIGCRSTCWVWKNDYDG